MIFSIIQQGLIFSLVTMAVFITSRIINKDDLTVEGSFGLGGAITAVMLQHHVNPFLVGMTALIAGALMGAISGILYTKLKMNHLMAGLTTTTAGFSLSLALASAHKNIADNSTIFSLIQWIPNYISETIILSAFALIIFLVLQILLRSQIGLVMKAVGTNANLLVHFGKSKDLYQIYGFMVANAITSTAAYLFVQWSGFFSITGSIGTLIAGLTSLMMAELIHRHLSLIMIMAAIAYQSIFAVSLTLGLSPVWNNLVKALIIIALVMLSKQLTKNHRRRSHA